MGALMMDRGLRGGRGDGFSLVEVVAALGIAAIVLIAILGLLPSGMADLRNTVEITQATQVARMIDSDLRASAIGVLSSATKTRLSSLFLIPLESGTTVFFVDHLGTRLPGPSSGYRAEVSVYTRNQGFTGTKTIAPVTHCSILLSWPASAPVAFAAGRLEVAGSFTLSPNP